MDQSCRHAKGALKADIEPLSKHFVKQIKLVCAYYEIEHAAVKVEQVINSKLLNFPKVLHHLLYGHTVQSGNFQIRLISISFAQC